MTAAVLNGRAASPRRPYLNSHRSSMIGNASYWAGEEAWLKWIVLTLALGIHTDAAMTQVYSKGQVAPVVNWNAGYRLPTESEWEKAARGGISGQRFPDGDNISESEANYYGDPAMYSYDLGPVDGFNPGFADGDMPYTSPVGSFAPNGYGLYDMAGNAWEWCWDYAGTYLPLSNGPARARDRSRLRPGRARRQLEFLRDGLPQFLSLRQLPGLQREQYWVPLRSFRAVTLTMEKVAPPAGISAMLREIGPEKGIWSYIRRLQALPRVPGLPVGWRRSI